MKPKALVLQAYGSNRDFDVIEAMTLAGADATGVPLNELRSHKALLSDFQLLVIPGGFSYADALGAGKLLGIDLASYFTDEISAFVDSGKPVIGICNGFQALVKSGILPGNPVFARGRWSSRSSVLLDSTLAPPTGARAGVRQVQVSTGLRSALDERSRNDIAVTLTFNAQGHFECRWVTLKPISQKCVWSNGLDELIECPVAHGEGNFQVSQYFPLSTFHAEDQIALIYAHPNGSPANGEYPTNPNGSTLDIAGISNPLGNVLGLMPHPENHIHSHQHPQWTRGVNHHSGLALFQNGVRYASQL